MKRIALLFILGFFGLLIGITSCIAIVGGINSSQYVASQLCNNTAAINASFVDPVSGVSLSTSGLTVKGQPMSSSQAKIVATMAGIVAARKSDFPGDSQHKATVLTIITTTQESTIQNLPAGDLDSAGAFQQRSGWGTYAQRTNVTYATNAFLNALVKVNGWQSMPLGDAAQAVQRSAFPDAYQQWISEAERTWSNLSFKGGSQVALAADVTTPVECAQIDAMQQKISLAIQACLSKVGNDWKPTDGVSLVSWCYEQAGIKLPTTLEGLVGSAGDATSGVETNWIPASNLTLQPGDLPLFGKSGSDQEKDATSTGLYVGSYGDGLRVATYNVRGSTHTASSGSQSGPERVKRAAALIQSQHFSVVGLQELQANQRAALMKTLGRGYGIYPAKPQYGLHYKGINSVNSIIWNKSQVSLVSGNSLPMPYYFNMRSMHIPLVKLQDVKSGQDFYVSNTHDPAGAYAHVRFMDAQQHAKDADSITSDGTPMFFTGDFNSAYTEHAKINQVWRHQRKYMTWCVMTRSGSMLDGYDASRTPVRTGECPPQTTREKGAGPVDHVYVSSNIRVSAYQYIANRQVTASDHGVVYIDASLPGASTATQHKSSKAHDQYVGVNAGEKVKLRQVSAPHLLGVIRLSLATPSVETGQAFIGNDGFPGGECVAYVEWILGRHSSRYHGGSLTNQSNPGYHAAYTVAGNLGKLGYLVNNTPAIHATVSFGTTYADPTFGHVAMVSQINQDGSIVVEEANWANYHAYGTHTVPASEVPHLTYAHTEVGWH